MNLDRLAVTTSATAAALWAAKAVAIAVAGGLGRSPAEGPLFLLGLAACVVAAVVTGMAVADRRTTAGRALAGLAGAVVAAVYGTVEGAVIAAVQPPHPGWVWGELNLWVLVLTVLAVAVAVRTRRTDPAGAPVPA